MAAVFTAIVVTANPPGLAHEGSGEGTKIDGREALLRSVELFLNREAVKQVLVSVDSATLDEAKRKYGNHLGFSGVKLAVGTARWMDQLAAAVEKLLPETTHVIVHDASRPAVPYSDIDALLDAAAKHDAVALTAPVRTPLLELDEGGSPVAQHSASRYVQLLTPQVFSRAKFLELCKAKQEPHASQWTLIKGSPLNVRIAGAGDASVARAMIGMLPKPKLKASSSPFEEAQW